MIKLKGLFKIAGVAMCIGIAAPVFAQAAPVYDADTMQDEGSSEDQAQYLPPPPPPGQEGNTFIPVQSTVSAADQRPQQAEQQASNVQGADSAAQVDSLQSQVQALRGQVEQLTHQLEQLQTQQKTMYTDLDGRIAKPVEAKPVSANAPAADNAVVADTSADDAAAQASAMGRHATKPVLIKTTKKQTTSSDMKKGGQPNIAEEQQIYQTAYNLIKVKRYNDAVTALQGMLKKYPSGQFASNAHYWLGELYGIMSKNDLALNEFQTVVDVYPDSPRVSDAQLKVGLLLASQFKWPEAKSALKSVVSNYPGSASARMAAEQLKQIKVAGH
jgi:tol-pal system protein YbgF